MHHVWTYKESGRSDRSARNEEIKGGPSVFNDVSWKGGMNSITFGAILAVSRARSCPKVEEGTDNLIVVQAASSLPPDMTSLLPEEPSTIHKAQVSQG